MQASRWPNVDAVHVMWRCGRTFTEHRLSAVARRISWQRFLGDNPSLAMILHALAGGAGTPRRNLVLTRRQASRTHDWHVDASPGCSEFRCFSESFPAGPKTVNDLSNQCQVHEPKVRTASNNRLKLTARGRSGAESLRRTRAAA